MFPTLSIPAHRRISEIHRFFTFQAPDPTAQTAKMVSSRKKAHSETSDYLTPQIFTDFPQLNPLIPSCKPGNWLRSLNYPHTPGDTVLPPAHSWWYKGVTPRMPVPTHIKGR